MAVIMTVWLLAIVGSDPPAVDEFDKPGWGVRFVDLDSASGILKEHKIKPPAKGGAYVLFVRAFSPLDNAKIKTGDVISRWNGEKLNSGTELLEFMQKAAVGDRVRLDVYRLMPKGKSHSWRQATIPIVVISMRDVLKAAMVRHNDEVSGASIIRHRNSPEFVNERTSLSAQFPIVDGKSGELFLRLIWVGNDVLGIRSFLIKADERSISIDPPPFAIKSDFASKRVWEWYVAQSEPETVKSIGEAKKVTVRFHGMNYSKDYEMPEEEIDHIKAVYDAWTMTR